METFFFIISYFTCATTLIGVFQIYWIYFRSGKRKIQGCNTCRLLELWWERELEMRKLVQIWNWCTDAKHVNRVQSLIFLIFPTDFVNFLRRKNTVLPRLVNVKNGDNFQKDFPTRLRWQKPVLESDAHLGCPPLSWVGQISSFWWRWWQLQRRWSWGYVGWGEEIQLMLFWRKIFRWVDDCDIIDNGWVSVGCWLIVIVIVIAINITIIHSSYKRSKN